MKKDAFFTPRGMTVAGLIACCLALTSPTGIQADTVASRPAAAPAPVASGSPVELRDGVAEGLPEGGLVVTVGLRDAATLAGLENSGRRLVNALVADTAAVEALRVDLHTRGVAGLVVVHAYRPGQPLPFAENQVDAVICDPGAMGGSAPTDAELTRITAPFGVTVVKRGEKWERSIKPRPKTMDDWRSFYGGPGQNPLNQDTLAGPMSTPRWMSTTSASIGSGMRIEGPFAVHSGSRPPLTAGAFPRQEAVMQVRSAFSGVPLATLPMKDDPRRFVMISGGSVIYRDDDTGPLKLYWVAEGKTVAVAPELTALTPPADLKGREKETWLGMRRALSRMVPLDDGGFLSGLDGRIACFNKDATLRWSNPDAGLHFPVVSNGLIIGVTGAPDLGAYGDRILASQGLRALHLKDGSVAWDSPASKGGVVRRFYGAADGMLAFTWLKENKGWHGRPNNVTVIDVATGKVKWEKVDAIRGVTIDTLIADGKLWLTSVSSAAIFSVADGTEVKDVKWPQWNCQEARATPNWYLAGTTFIPVSGADAAAPPNIVAKGITRASCNIGQWPANGLVYSTGTNCTCYDQWRGNGAFASDSALPIEDEKTRLERGPQPAGKAVAALPNSGWPTWNADIRRGAGVAGAISPTATLRWRTQLSSAPRTGPIADEWSVSETVNGLISQAVIAEGKAFVALPDEHRVAALDLATGKVLWSYIAGSRIDGPPTVAGGTAYFGCRDGWVYALDVATGGLRWRYLVAPARRNIVADGHLESVWPVYAPVILHDGGLFAAAGRQSGLANGISVVRIDPATGAAVWRKTWYSGDARNAPSERGKPTKNVDYLESINDLLTVSNGLICLGYQAFDARTGEHGPIERGLGGGGQANERNSSATIGGRAIRVARIAASRLGMVHDGDLGNIRTYDGLGAPFFAIDLAGGRVYSLHGGKMRTSSGGQSSGRGDLVAWPITAEGLLTDPDGKGSRPNPTWKKSWPDGKDGGPSRVALIRVGTQLAVAERFNGQPKVPKHAIALHDAADGSVIGRVELPLPPIRYGLSSDGKRVLVILDDGSVACLE